MNLGPTATIVLSFLTASTIVTFGALGVAAIGGTPTKWQIISSVGLGLVAGAKDIRSLLKLSPVDGGKEGDK